MQISGIDNLDIGMSNIEIEGKVTYEKVPRHVEGDNERGHYDFYSQFVVIDDGTGKIGCNVSIEKEEYRLEKGIMARVKGKLEQYKDKNGETQKSLKGSLVAISRGNKETNVQLEVAKEYFDDKAKETIEVMSPLTAAIPAIMPTSKPVEKPIDKNAIWEAKDLRIARECAVKAVTELVCVKIMKNKDFFVFADTIVKYIYNGNQQPEAKPKEKPKPTKEEKLALARHLADAPSKLELREGYTGLLDEKEEPGSSPDNAIKFKSKKRTHPVTIAEDFISPSDMPE